MRLNKYLQLAYLPARSVQGRNWRQNHPDNEYVSGVSVGRYGGCRLGALSRGECGSLGAFPDFELAVENVRCLGHGSCRKG